MGQRGMAPKPSNVRRLHGTPESKLNNAEPVPSDGAVEAPAWLDADALAIWDKYAPDLIRKKVLTAWDVDAFGVYCDSVARYAELAIALRAEGYTVAQATGSEKINPKATLQKQYADSMVKLGGRFGLTPSDRSSISIDAVETKSRGPERFFS